MAQARAGPWGTHKATFCHVGWKATGQGPVISRGCAEGETQRVRWSRYGVSGECATVRRRPLHAQHWGTGTVEVWVGGEADGGMRREASGLGASVLPHPSCCAHAEALALWECLSLVGPRPPCAVGPVGWGPEATWL